MNHEELKATIRKYAEEKQVFFSISDFSENSEQEVYLAFQAVQNEGPFYFHVTIHCEDGHHVWTGDLDEVPQHLVCNPCDKVVTDPCFTFEVVTPKQTPSKVPMNSEPLSPEKVTTVRFNVNDQLVLEQLSEVTGIQSTTEIIRLALRHLLKKPFP